MSTTATTPYQILEHADKYKRGAWRDYSLMELGNWVHLLVKRALHRDNPAKRNKDLDDAQNYLHMMQAHIDHERGLPEFIQYEHHGQVVWVRSRDKGTHRSHCLCFSCDKFAPGQPTNCPVAQRLYQICVDEDMTTPVYECPRFQEKK